MKKLKISLRLQTKIAIINIVIVFIPLIITTLFISDLRMIGIKNEIKKNTMNIAKIIANSKITIKTLEANKSPEIIRNYISGILSCVEDINAVVITDIRGKKYINIKVDSIKSSEMINNEINSDINITKTQNDYIPEGAESFGNQIIAFLHVRNEKGVKIGFVIVKSIVKNIEDVEYKGIVKLIFIEVIGFCLGFLGIFVSSKSIKRTLLGYEPEQISKLYLQKNEVLDALYEGIIVVDEKFKVTFFNTVAIKILKIKNENVNNNNIYNIISNSYLNRIMETGQAEYDVKMIVNNIKILCNIIPIKVKDDIVGVVYIFRDKTEVTRLAEEVTGVNQIVESLRANTHEFMNKMHVILGLIQIGESQEAEKFIINETKQQQEKISLVMNSIKNPTIAGLLLGKMSNAKENAINLCLNNNSVLKKENETIENNLLVTIIGNLIDNAIDSINVCDKDERYINILIKEEEYKIVIKVEDTGGGILKDNIYKIFEKGFSTKGNNRGRGLARINNIVKNLHGEIKVSSEVGIGTKFIVSIPKKEEQY
ncbi:ATP-binding protein [Clostridium aestuarii]|uniref:histidine kinase n=1 Tax=Clostridium aestuarii TaxID=338193 RepID=A0ABT4D1Q0_9CLOT|nr:ATP-binding protein [Clostridium aestuarii]MCY6485171.1 ATP-binding protein [Clostridium aestuarii]